MMMTSVWIIIIQSLKKIGELYNIKIYATEQDLSSKYRVLSDKDDYFPIQHTFKLNFTLDKEIVSTCDYSFDEKFLKSWSETFSDKQIEAVYDLPDKAFEWGI